MEKWGPQHQLLHSTDFLHLRQITSGDIPQVKEKAGINAGLTWHMHALQVNSHPFLNWKLIHTQMGLK